MRLQEVFHNDGELPIAYTMAKRILAAGKKLTLVIQKPYGMSRIGWIQTIELVGDSIKLEYFTNATIPMHLTKRQAERATIKTLSGLKGDTGDKELCFIVPTGQMMDQMDAIDNIT